jgi:hypothetical protein
MCRRVMISNKKMDCDLANILVTGSIINRGTGAIKFFMGGRHDEQKARLEGCSF